MAVAGADKPPSSAGDIAESVHGGEGGGRGKRSVDDVLGFAALSRKRRIATGGQECYFAMDVPTGSAEGEG